MDPATIATIVGWFAQPAAQALFTVAQTYVQRRLGLSSSPSQASQVEPLLDKYLQKLIARLDEDRIAKLYGAFSKLRDAPKSVAKHGLLNSALDGFHEVARIPEQGITGDRPNAELRCMAFIGMVASYTLLQDRADLIEEKMIEAVSADAATAKQWLGEDIVREILARLPAPTISCPQCGFQNPTGSKFCNRDGYPLTSGQKPSSQPSSSPSILHLIREKAFSDATYTFQIILDNKMIGTINNGKSCSFEVEPGHHIISLRTGFASSPHLIFDTTPGEKVMFRCQGKAGILINSILLWKDLTHSW